MRRYSRMLSLGWGAFLIAGLSGPTARLDAQSSAPWKDTSPHATQLVSVEQNVQLEVLDWGGPGGAIILLAGGAKTAHIFDDFAPKLATRWTLLCRGGNEFGGQQAS